ncbi:uncharacterized protein LOC114289148 [Camellia sinensis]|uniref:uncharacterized protein LOC114289148 n=1 Tax=Camellia sinensis TaxID=4442 RepID=UPI0010363E6E|nr:uncharacterized protein LOC114289148 [Camellia sinensis]
MWSGGPTDNLAWFSEFPNWLEYIVAKDAAFCLCCYLFKLDIGNQAGSDSFVGEGFSNRKKKEKIQAHVGGLNSAHNQASSKCQDLLNQNQHIQTIFFKQSDQARIEYRTRLNASVNCVKFLLRQGLTFRGYDEFENSSNQGNFLELINFLANHNEDVIVVAFSNAPQNLKLTSPDIQKDIVNVAAFEAINVIIRDLVINVLEMILENGSNSEQRVEANVLLDSIQSFEFVFNLHLVKTILAITSELSQALQRKDQNIVNAMNLVQISKVRLQKMRKSGWTSLLDDILCFCEKHEIDVPQMDDMFIARGRKRHNAQEITNLHHYRAELFYIALDMQTQELNARFTESNTKLLLCVPCLNPSNPFSSFYKKKLIHLAEFYRKEFSSVELKVLNDQLDIYIIDMLPSSELSRLNEIADLAKKMVETGRDKIYPLAYLLLTLALILHVATAIVERVFLAMNIVKNRLQNRIGDEWINDKLEIVDLLIERGWRVSNKDIAKFEMSMSMSMSTSNSSMGSINEVRFDNCNCRCGSKTMLNLKVVENDILEE